MNTSFYFVFTSLPQPGLVALRERYLRHVKAPKSEQGERTMQLDIICKNKTPSGKEELCTESLTVSVKEKAKEPPTTKPGAHTAAILVLHAEIPQCRVSHCEQLCQL